MNRRGFLPRSLPLTLVKLAGTHPRIVLLVYFFLLAGAGYYSSYIRIESDFLALIPEKNQVIREFRTTVNRFGSIDILLVALELDKDSDMEANFAFADYMAGELRAAEEIDWVEYRVQDFIAAAETLLDQVTLFLGPDELETLLTRFDEEGTRRTAERLAERLRSPLDMGYRDLLLRDPMGVAPLLLDRFDPDALGTQFDSESGYLVDAEERFILMLVKPVKPAADLPFSRALMTRLDAVRDQAEAGWREEGWEEAPPKALYGGGYAITVGEAGLIIDDMVIGMVFALVAVVLLFTFAFGRPTALVISAAPLICGLAITFGFVTLVIGNLNAATSAFAALLIGLGVDFIIVLYGRYLEERRSGIGHEEALEVFGRNTAAGVLLGAVTTAATFYAFMISGFRGLSELGLLTGTGILFLVITVFLMLPALLTVFERMRPGRNYHLRAFGLQRLCGFSMRNPVPVLVVCGIFTAITAWSMFSIVYDNNINNMRSPKNPGLNTQSKVMQAFGIRFTPTMIRVDGASEVEAVNKTRDLLARLTPLVDGENLARIDSILTYFPDYATQEQIIQRLASFELDEAAYTQQFSEALTAQGINPRPFVPNLQPLYAALKVDKPFSFADVEGSTLDHITERYLAKEGDVYSAMIYCYVPVDRWIRQIPPKLTEIVDATPGAIATGPVVISIELKRIVLRDAMIAMFAGTLIVLLFLAWDLGSARAGLFALIPLLVGMVWMLGTMTLLDIPVNFMNIFVFTMIIGIGVDYGIHLIHRWHETGGGPRLLGTAKTIMIAALTTVLGFGSLALSHYPGLRSLGIVAILGALYAAFASITLLPALLVVTKRFLPESLRAPAGKTTSPTQPSTDS